jgi:hypothetical protein
VGSVEYGRWRDVRGYPQLALRIGKALVKRLW